MLKKASLWIIILVTVTNRIYGSVNWRYGDNALGQENWPELFPYQCAGLSQSPIDIHTRKTVYDPDLPRIKFTEPTPGSKFVVHNTGHSIQVNTSGDIYMYGGGIEGVYKIEQFHFHWGDNSEQGAEHRINGVEYPIELHIVSWNVNEYSSMAEAMKHPDGIAVLGVLFRLSMYDNPVLQPVIQAIPRVTDPDLNYYVEIAAMPMRDLVPYTDGRFYRYHGSLTTPICLESVTWTVYDNILSISDRQLNAFRHVLTPAYHTGTDPGPDNGNGEFVREYLVNNYRPVQPLHGRTVYRSFKA